MRTEGPGIDIVASTAIDWMVQEVAKRIQSFERPVTEAQAKQLVDEACAKVGRQFRAIVRCQDCGNIMAARLRKQPSGKWAIEYEHEQGEEKP